MLEIRGYEQADVAGMAQVWNEVVEGGIVFPQEEKLDEADVACVLGAVSRL